MRDEIYDALREHAKQAHRERVAKTPERITYAEHEFEKRGIRYALKNAETGHFHAWDSQGKLRQFWASTGKIMGSNRRGIHNFINILEGK